MATLTTARRKNLPSSDFALPGRRYPVEDKAHARDAKARASQALNAGRLTATRKSESRSQGRRGPAEEGQIGRSYRSRSFRLVSPSARDSAPCAGSLPSAARAPRRAARGCRGNRPGGIDAQRRVVRFDRLRLALHVVEQHAQVVEQHRIVAARLDRLRGRRARPRRGARRRAAAGRG